VSFHALILGSNIAKHVVFLLEHQDAHSSASGNDPITTWPRGMTEMFTKSDNVVSRLNQTISSKTTDTRPLSDLERSDDLGGDDESTGEDSDEYRATIEMLRRYLCVNRTFEWLKSRIQTIVKSANDHAWMLRSNRLSDLLLSMDYEKIDYGIKIVIDWDLQEFMERNYPGFVDIADVVSISSSTETCEADTVGEYIARVWPITGLHFLRLLQDWWRQISAYRHSSNACRG
jgi:hypothetical protein